VPTVSPPATVSSSQRSPRTASSFLALALLGLVACQPAERAGAPVTAPPVEAVPARTGSLPLVERLSGTVFAENQVALYAEVSGRVAEIFVNNGDTVAAGTPLLRLQDDSAREQVRQAEASLRIEEARMRQAQTRLAEIDAQTRRIAALGDRNLVSDVELETLAAQRASAAADVDLVEAQVERAASTVAERQDILARSIVRAPVAGSIGNRDAELGMQVTPSTRLFTLGNLDRVTVRINLTDTMLRYIAVGQPVRIFPDDIIHPATSASPLAATLRRISPFLNQVTRSTTAEIELTAANQVLRPGMFVPVDIFYGASRQATLVPTSALFTDPNTGREGVFVARHLTEASVPVALDPATNYTAPVAVTFRPIRAIARGASEVAVDAVESGEWVVTLGQNLLATGRSQARVRLVSWDHVLNLQGLRREDLLADVLNPTGLPTSAAN
jgi:RND family efflux transporter MFP subunit